MSNVAAPRTRKPTGKPGWPRILVSGAEGSWKSGTSALLSADERLGEMFWLEVGDGETTADEYGSLPGVRYTILEHDGTWLDIYNQLDAAWHVAKEAEEKGEPPIPLTIDAMSGIWSMLMDLGDNRARVKAAKQLAEQKKDTAIAWSADYESNITSDLWMLIKKRHGQLMTKVLTWPGPVLLISRERMATVFENGQPTKHKDWTLECNKSLPSQCTAWVRLEGGGVARIRKLRSAKLATAVDMNERDRRVSDFSFATLIFDWVGCEAGVSRAARMVTLNADQDMPDEVTHIGGQQQAPAPLAAVGDDGLTRDQRARVAASGAQWVQAVLEAATVEAAADRAAVLASHWSGKVDVLGMVPEDVRERLGVGGPDTTRLSLVELADACVVYTGKHKISPLADEAEEAPPTVFPGDPSEDDRADAGLRAAAQRMAGDVLVDRHTGDTVPRAEVEALAREFNPMRMAQES